MLGKLALIGGAVAFARSTQGKKAIAQARQKYDTPENRQVLQQKVATLKGGKGSAPASA